MLRVIVHAVDKLTYSYVTRLPDSSWYLCTALLSAGSF